MVLDVEPAVRPPCVYRHFEAILDVKRPVLARGLCQGHSIRLLYDHELQLLVNCYFKRESRLFLKRSSILLKD